MTTLTKSDIGVTWVDLVSELGLAQGVSYIVQNVSPYPLEIKDKSSLPTSDEFGQVMAPNSPWVITVGANGIYIRNQNNDERKLGRVAVTNTTSIAGPYVNNIGASGDSPLYTQDVDYNNRGSLNTLFGEKIMGIRKPSSAAQFQYGIQLGNADIEVLNGGAITTNESLLIGSTGTAANGYVRIQTKDYLRYLPGHEAYAVFTAVFTQGVENSFQRVGLFDGDDGFFIGYEGEDFCVSRGRAGVIENTVIDLSNIFPDVDGVFNPSKGNVYRISYGYLGFATINVEVMAPCGCWRLLHKIAYPNSEVVTHITQTNLPLRAELGNTGNTTDIKISSGSYEFGVVDGGSTDVTSRYFSVQFPTTAITAGNFLAGILRNKDIFNSVDNRVSSQLTLISAGTDTSKVSSWSLVKNPTITNTPTWVDVNTADSVMEYSLNATITFGTGDILIPWNMAKLESFFQILTDADIVLRAGDSAAIIVNTPGGSSGTIDSAFRFKELF